MNVQILQPAGFLRNYIKQYCFMESGINDGNVVERVIPVENVQLMFHYKNPFIVIHPDRAGTGQPRSIVSGLNDSFSDVSTNGAAGVVFVSFHTAGACHFFSFPLSEIENQNVDLSDIFPAEMRRVEAMLFEKKTLAERVAVIESFLTGRFSPIPLHESLLLRKGIACIKDAKGQITATSLADSLSTTTKSLERKFSRYLGKTPKQIIRLLRFQEVLKGFSTHKNVSQTERAYLHGYFDQAHFIRDFSACSGYTPKAFISCYPDFTLPADFC